MTKHRLVHSLSLLSMKPTRMLLAIRKASDLESASLFLKEQPTRPYLVIAFLNFQIPGTNFASEFKSTPISRETCSRSLNGFDFEIAPLPYRGDRLPASVFAEECAVRKCDSVIVVSDGKKQLHASDLASTLAVESRVPVIVIKP
jgi:hypothetical protein